MRGPGALISLLSSNDVDLSPNPLVRTPRNVRLSTFLDIFDLTRRLSTNNCERRDRVSAVSPFSVVRVLRFGLDSSSQGSEQRRLRRVPNNSGYMAMRDEMFRLNDLLTKSNTTVTWVKPYPTTKPFW